MSKSPNPYLIPALSGTVLMLGLAYGYSSKNYGASEIEALEQRITQVETHSTAANARAENAEMAVAEAAEKASAMETSLASALAAAGSGDGTGSLTMPVPANAAVLGLGREAVAVEIAAWDIDVLPDGRGLPEGRGNAYDGEEIFAEKCASCHGDFAEGVDNWPVLAGGFDTLADKDPVKTVGSYWPYLSTVFDYVNRSMPFGAAQTLTADEVYAIVAYILYSNDLVDDDFELSHENFSEFEMYNSDGFILDDRAETEYAMWRAEPCMSDCKDSVEITMHASVVDVTPDEGGAEEGAAMEEAAHDDAAMSLDPELVKAGEKVFKKCKACHAVGDGAKSKTGPVLNGLFGRTFAGVDGFKYSNGFVAAGAEGRIWDEAQLAEFLTKPKTFIKGTKMSFAGLKKETDIAAITEYLKSFGE